MIHNVWILNRNGICLIDRIYSKMEVDKNLFGGFLTAIESFSKQLVDKHVDSIVMGNMKILYNLSGKVVIAIAIDVDDDEKEIRRKVNSLLYAFLEKYETHLDSTNVDIFEDFQKEMDKILYLDWNFEYDRKIRQKLK